MALATKGSQVVDRIRDILVFNKEELGLEYVDTGEDDLIPTYPAALVSSRDTNRDIKGTHQYSLSFTVDIIVMFEKIQAGSITREAMEPIAEAIDTLITGNRQLLDENSTAGSEMVIHGFCTRIAYGITKYNDEILQATRITWEGLSQEYFNG